MRRAVADVEGAYLVWLCAARLVSCLLAHCVRMPCVCKALSH